jgi:NAD(P)-dependent dehydrogenase (short-subunit alcohol dehydrogenase family)
MERGTVVVTGTSSGIGRACVAVLAGRGFRVLAGVRRESDGEAVRALAPDRVEPVLLDVTDDGAISALAERVDGPLAGLVNNAGLSRPGPLEHLPIDGVRHELDVMLVAPFALTRALLPALRAGRGRVVNVGSIGGRMAMPFMTSYHAAKFGMEGFSDALRREVEPVGVRVALVEPGSIATPIWGKGEQAGDALLAALPPEGRQVYGERLERFAAAARRTGERGIAPGKVAEAVAHALTAEQPKTRYLVGRDARGQALLAAVLGDRVLDRLLRRLVG